MLIAPEGDTRRRRHAHTECVLAARARGELVLRDEWLRTQPRAAVAVAAAAAARLTR